MDIEIFRDYFENAENGYKISAKEKLIKAIDLWNNYNANENMPVRVYENFDKHLNTMLNYWENTALLRNYLDNINIYHYENNYYFYKKFLIMEAICTDNPFMFYQFIKMGANTRYEDTESDFTLLLACLEGGYKADIFYLKTLLETKNVNLKYIRKDGKTLLEYSKIHSHPFVYEYFKNYIENEKINKLRIENIKEPNGKQS